MDDHADARIRELETALAACVEAMKVVNSHRSEDRDGNHVAWVGESTFAQVDSALSAAAPLVQKDGE